MRAILLISSVLVLASHARPDVSHGYQYNTPQDNYQGAVPDQSNNYGSSSETLPNFVPVQTHSGPGVPPVYPDTQQPDNFVPTGPSDVQLQGVPQFAQTAPEQQNNVENQVLTTGSEAYNNQQQQSFSTSYDSVPSGIPQQQQQQQQQSFGGSQQSFGGSQQSFGGSQQSFGGSQQQAQSSSFGSSQQQNTQNTYSSLSSQASQSDELPPIITKHFYVHAAPEEPEESQGPRFVNIGRKQKNYKIIFIKAPTYGFNSQVIPIIQPNEEKTIVYVLSKKPSFNQDISLPPAPVTEPTKPEVFFIKYKTEGEAQEAQQKIQGAYENANLGGANDNNVFANIGGNIGNAISSFQNQASSSFNTAVGQAQGVASGFVNNIGSAVGNQQIGSRPSTIAVSQTANNDEQQQYNNGASSVSANLVEATKPEQSAQQQQQNDEHVEYLPPNQ